MVETLPNSFYEARINLLPKPDKAIRKKIIDPSPNE
jgi:hypothetical protein